MIGITENKGEHPNLSLIHIYAVNANILGAVLNGFDTKSTEKKNGYYYSYNYSYENADR